MRGEKEQRCLDRVCKSISIENCYAVSSIDYDNIKNYLNKAKPNPQSSVFPDFLFPGGFIEHFQISSSIVNRRGSKHIKDKAHFEKIFAEKQENFMATMGNTKGEVKSVSGAFHYKEHSYENLKTSFKKNWENHLQSLGKAPEFEKQIGIFMLAYSDTALHMSENIYDSSTEGLYLHIRDNQMFYDYRLSRDKNLLRYILQKKGVIKYVIFVNTSDIEIISVDNIEAILKQLPWEFVICPAVTIERHATYGFSIPLDNDEDGGKIE